jgi:hypothetical protein
MGMGVLSYMLEAGRARSAISHDAVRLELRTYTGRRTAYTWRRLPRDAQRNTSPSHGTSCPGARARDMPPRPAPPILSTRSTRSHLPRPPPPSSPRRAPPLGAPIHGSQAQA